MQVKDLIYNYNISDLELIRTYCSEFLEESGGFPIVRSLPNTYENFQKVKVRKRKSSNSFSSTFNGAFEDQMIDLRERSVFVNGRSEHNESLDPFYVFPIDGYDFLYSKEVDNSTENYKHVYESIISQLGEKSAKMVFTDLLRFSYNSEELAEGIGTGAEIIIYNIPYYYAIRESYVENYNELLTMIV